MARVVVVGAGVIGLCCAHALRARGLEVLVIDAAAPGEGASHGNGGWVCPSLSGPVPAPGITLTSLRWLLQPDSPLYIKPRADVRFARWLWQFWRHCNERDYARALDAVARFNQPTLALYDALAAGGVRFEMHQQGLLFLFRTHAAARAERDEVSRAEQYGSPPARWLSPDALRHEEPHASPTLIGGLLAPAERHVRPESLCAGLVESLQAQGVEIRAHEPAIGFRQRGHAVTGVRTARGTIEADQVVLAAGVWTGALARMLHHPLPIEAGKGYSITADRAAYAIRRPLYFSETRVGLSPYNGGVRVLGTMELSGLNGDLPPRRLTALRRAPALYLTDWRTTRPREQWTGMRPLTPDGLPVIGALPAHPNVLVASGHAMLGVTLGPATGEAIAALAAGQPPAADLSAFRPDRF